MDFFTQTFTELDDYNRLCEAVDNEEVPVCVTGLSLVHKAQLALTLSTRNTPALLLITGTEAEALRLVSDINAMSGETTAMHFPAKEMTFLPVESKSAEYEHERLHVLSAVCRNEIRIVAASAEAVMQPTIPLELLRTSHILLEQGGTTDLNELTQQLIHSGYVRCETVEGQGQFAVRGSIVDVFPVQLTAPVRMELWGDEIDTLTY
ncbi:MAG: transcription-repair coupling factor, partial [Oscillospiraceae bacterium]|nr:transcription-repair coupling factor [Oscillospiraceae bacterium]